MQRSQPQEWQPQAASAAIGCAAKQTQCSSSGEHLRGCIKRHPCRERALGKRAAQLVPRDPLTLRLPSTPTLQEHAKRGTGQPSASARVWKQFVHPSSSIKALAALLATTLLHKLQEDSSLVSDGGHPSNRAVGFGLAFHPHKPRTLLLPRPLPNLNDLTLLQLSRCDLQFASAVL